MNPLLLIGGLAGVLIAIGMYSTRPAAPPPPPTPEPPPTPRPRPTPRPADMTFTVEEAREIGHALTHQGTIPDPPDSRSIRILQQQMFDLGYRITRIDGRNGEELRTAIGRFARANGLPYDVGLRDLMMAVDSEYSRRFNERGYV